MKIQDLLQKNAMILSLNATNKADAISEMVQKLVDTGYVTDYDTFKDGILAREALTTTGLGDGIAMPHSKNAAVKEAVVLFAKKDGGLDYESLDGQPTDLFFMIAAPDGANDTHLAALAELSKYLMKDGFADSLRATSTPDQVLAAFNAAEAATVEEAVAAINNDGDFVVAVTACTTGIAHTYMAEEALKKQAKALGVAIKVETNGASGIGNKLTAEDIKKAKGVIIAADKAVEMDRFDGKPLILKPVAAGIREPENLIKAVLSGNLPTYKATGQAQENNSEEKLSIGKAFYKHLMSGVSSMLPFVIGGGIAIAIAFLIDNAMGVPKDQLANLGSYHELASVFKQLGGAAFGFMLPILAGYIAYSIAEKPGLVAGFVAGAIASNGLAFGKVPFASGGEKTLALAGVPSGFLGALVGGFLAGGVILILKKVFSNVPRSLNGIVSILVYPVLGVLITGFLMLFVNIPMAAINSGLTNFLNSLSGANAVLLGALLGGMMAIDMGGPFNKTAYVFGTGTLAATVASGGSVVMAAVMAGGMVPPLAVFVATLLFKNKFTKEEQDSGLTNIVMGLSFITEGAIPFGAADPARAIPSFILGSAVTGGLVGALGIKLMAPHGGIFVIALTSNPIMYLVAVAIGAVISGIVFGALRKAK
ncbi:MAG: fructose-specific PTS transporter subunit EIIC [Lactococcus chungangensis]|jgi:PTS system, fructose-specific, IIB component/PTS system, fructose subfamily, IIA component/PTS system, fructose subfamily, IIC component|uniref:PTS fructose transporter subunit IIC n=2 Tax=Pseudolactococcus chungangensis TaxID=451457 RepID=A0A1K2HAJ7_9LACT|nr:fructose-specific PTS transporter subunit EIIC [Lactococcus chungangensis]MDD3015892.1 fructose-specific PTS transporter subunit EIIC [Lactococcus chungangensis]NLH36029.1 PTS transporter subunit EIIA [Lactococcus chungangensis]PCS04768.1 PTS fructose transporter subunit IIC [Lactococcus chungangensis CAU 28 = DSM 22330]SFZ73799.1 PTS system, fructose-specific IIC component [Lactococcus chungangensis CAU 28 = DSM 22330]